MAARDLLCAFCILARKKAELNAELARGGAVKAKAGTMWQGIAICYDHVVVTPAPPGSAARAAGLQV